MKPFADERGSQSLEFLATLPLLLVLLAAFIQLFALSHRLLVGQMAVREAARAAVAATGLDLQAVAQAAADRVAAGRWELCPGQPLIAIEGGLVVARLRPKVPVLTSHLPALQSRCLTAAFAQER